MGKFFEPVAEGVSTDVAAAKYAESAPSGSGNGDKNRNRYASREDRNGGGYGGGEGHRNGSEGGPQHSVNTWDKNRIWRVVNLATTGADKLPMVNRPEPFAPGTQRLPPDEDVVRWLADGD